MRKSWLLFFAFAAFGCYGQEDECHHAASIAMSPGFYNKHYSSMGLLVGLQDELYLKGREKMSFVISLDFRTARNLGQSMSPRFYAFAVRPGLRFYYWKNRHRLFNGLSILASSEVNNGSTKSIYGYGGSMSIGYKFLFRKRLFVELECAAGAVKARFLYPNAMDDYEHLHFLGFTDLRFGYRFPTVTKKGN